MKNAVFRTIFSLAAALLALPTHAAEPKPPIVKVLQDMVDGKLVAIDPASHTVAYVTTWAQEGTGLGAMLMVRDREGQAKGTQLFDPNDDDAAVSLAKAITPATAVLTAKPYQFVPATDWPEKQPTLPLNGGTLAWKKNQLQWNAAGAKAAVTLAKVVVRKPFTAYPSALYARAGLPIALVRVEMDPGKHYGEGFNHVSQFEVLDLPQPATASGVK